MSSRRTDQRGDVLGFRRKVRSPTEKKSVFPLKSIMPPSNLSSPTFVPFPVFSSKRMSWGELADCVCVPKHAVSDRLLSYVCVVNAVTEGATHRCM